ncbi:MAG: protein DedA [Deltaproteobacteria bacterium]|jgi:membrane-associated protein|nr:putative membrane protein [bacterium HR37]GIW47429.1 MAG: protein DedA [Deltaproteobacteria bacterium]
MEITKDIFEIIVHFDRYLGVFIRSYGVWTYVILSLIIFCETGLVVLTPFLPGDTLLFAAGTFAALGLLEIEWVIILLSASAVAGDSMNYWIGYYIGPKAFSKKGSLFFNKKYLERTHQFYEKYGGKAIIIARFIPFIRTFSPFVAGIGRMSYKRFTVYDIAGGILWVLTFSLGGYFFGRIPVVKNNFIFVILAIILIPVLPGIIRFVYKQVKYV